MKTKVKQILCVLLLNSILLTVVFSAPAALANEKAFTESTTYSDASVSQSSASPPQRLVTNKKGEWIKASNGKYWYRHTDGSYTKNDWEYRANQESNPIAKNKRLDAEQSVAEMGRGLVFPESQRRNAHRLA